MKRLSFGFITLFAGILLLSISCNNTTNGGGTETVVNGANLAAKLSWLTGNAQRDTAYLLEIKQGESIAAQSLSYGGRTGISIRLKGIGGERVISLTGTGSLFTIDSGVTLILDSNITLKGITGNTASLLRVSPGGKLVINTASKITGNSFSISGVKGGGVYVDGGTVTMNGGEISFNNCLNGGGVYVANGAFTMNGGAISENNADYSGAGVLVDSNAVFTMSGGKITDNRSDGGGGVAVGASAIFIMIGGEISGNTASFAGGAGVALGPGTFAMNGGKISGNITDHSGGGVNLSSGNFIMSGGAITGNEAAEGGGIALKGESSSKGNFTMSGSAVISGNTAHYTGGGVYMVSDVAFTMNSGEISGNTTGYSGGGVYVFGANATFTMLSGAISGNTSDDVAGGLYMSSAGTFRIVNGTIYGTNESNEALRNKVTGSGAAMFNDGDSQYGTFSGSTWNPNGGFPGMNSTIDNTIKVVNGFLQ